MAYDKQIPSKSTNLSDWYLKTIQTAELADYGPAKGTIIFRPYGYRIWELIQASLDAKIKAHEVDNAYFPLFIPESLLRREAEHVEGFAPELAVVTIGGGEELEEKLVVRPTSETIMYEAYARWIQSWRDLPLQINQWNSVVRWEKRTYPFMRTSEFLWQEGHTAHADHDEAVATQRWAMEAYVSVYRDLLALPGYVGRKSAAEKFAGADDTLTYELLMPEGKALQGCTSHDLGQNFARAFGIKYQAKDGGDEYVWQTSWGFSTRSLGGLIMAHGDDSGLVLPPMVAPVQVVIIPVRLEESVIDYCERLGRRLAEDGLRVRVDRRDGESFGAKINKWESRGVPLRFEIGAREVESGRLVPVTRGREKLAAVDLDGSVDGVKSALAAIQEQLLTAAETFLADGTRDAVDYEAFKEIMAGPRGFIRAFWCEEATCEAQIKAETLATTRCLPLDAPEESGQCIKCGRPAKHRWLFALAY